MQNKKALGLMFLVPLLWSPSFLFTSDIMQKIQPMTLIFIRFFVAFVALFVYMQYTDNAEKIKREDIKTFAIITGGCLGHYILSNFSTIYLNTTESIVFSSFQCITTMVAASFLLGTPVTVKNSMYVALFSIGAILTMSIARISLNVFFSYIGMLLSIVVWSLHCIYIPKLTAKYKLSTILYYLFKWIAICTFPFVFFEQNAWSSILIFDIVQLAYLCVPCTLIAFSINTFALKKIGALTVGFVMNIGPALVALLLAMFYEVELNTSQYVGILMICVGIFMIIVDEVERKNVGIGEVK